MARSVIDNPVNVAHEQSQHNDLSINNRPGRRRSAKWSSVRQLERFVFTNCAIGGQGARDGRRTLDADPPAGRRCHLPANQRATYRRISAPQRLLRKRPATGANTPGGGIPRLFSDLVRCDQVLVHIEMVRWANGIGSLRKELDNITTRRGEVGATFVSGLDEVGLR